MDGDETGEGVVQGDEPVLIADLDFVFLYVDGVVLCLFVDEDAVTDEDGVVIKVVGGVTLDVG